MRIEARYSGEEGAYISVIPDRRGVETLRVFTSQLKKYGLEEFVSANNDFHVTVMYSENQAPDPDKLPYLKPEARIQAYLMALNVWPGHDEDGHIVGRLHSPALVALNKFWSDLGCVSENFDEYKPHVTLASGFLKNGGTLPPTASLYIKKCNQYLKETPLKLTLFGHRIENISNDS
jgi:hypothetical protein